MDEIILQNKNGKILANSLEVAEKFGKAHNHVIRDIDDIISKSDCPNLDSEMFIENSYVNSRGKTYRCFEMNRDGFSLLAMGFNGKKAFEWKLKYINAFNEMEERLKSGNYLSEEEKLKLKLFSKDPLEVASAHNKLVELEVDKATAPLIPKAEYHDAVETASNCVNFGKFSANLQNNEGIKLGRNTIMDWCREMGYLCSSTALKNKPSQQMLSSGYMQYKQNITERNGKTYINYTPLLTGKGEIWLAKQLLKEC